jgi:hypothetical protein
MTSEIDIDRELVLTRPSGEVTAAEVEKHYRDLGTDPRFRRHFKQLIDLTQYTGRPYDAADVRGLAEEHVFAPGVPRAVVTASDATFGMSRMWAIQSELVGQKIQVFRDMEAAKAWLAL